MIRIGDKYHFVHKVLNDHNLDKYHIVYKGLIIVNYGKNFTTSILLFIIIYK